jgi:protoheme IX farnesyltransferase
MQSAVENRKDGKVSHRTPERRAGIKMREYVALLKLRIVGLLVLVSIFAALIASQGDLHLKKILVLAVAGVLACTGASMLNHYFDRDVDAVMERTRNRPLPSGKVEPRRVYWLGVLLIFLSLLVSLRLNPLTTAYILAGALVYVVVYTIWLKRRSAANIVVGGLAGSFAVLAGYAAMMNATSLLALLLALLLFLWTPPHFWAFAIVHRSSYTQASIPMLPVTRGEAAAAWLIFIHTVLLVIVSLMLHALGYFGTLYLAIALAFGTAFVALNVLLLLSPQRGRAWRSYRFSGIYLLAVFSGMLLEVYL